MLTKQHLDGMKAALDKIQGAPKEWLLIDPQGRVYRGEVADITPILLQHHPLLALPDLVSAVSTTKECPP